ncbi:MAG: transcriptional repressor, partial [Pseudomonadota bacterium]|nr:transcriptional repressor [Pseudomonadota bacterium]
RVLTQFETAGLVERHNFESGHSVFELATDDHHDHMVDVDTNDRICVGGTCTTSTTTTNKN